MEEQHRVLTSFFGDSPFPAPEEALLPRLNAAMYAGGGDAEKLKAWDQKLAADLGDLFPRLTSGEFDSWSSTPQGLICIVVLCDQV